MVHLLLPDADCEMGPNHTDREMEWFCWRYDRDHKWNRGIDGYWIRDQVIKTFLQYVGDIGLAESCCFGALFEYLQS